jgi:DNA polymerase
MPREKNPRQSEKTGTRVAELFPEPPSLSILAQAAQACTACDLYKWATQAVMGEGPVGAEAFFIGEQPGDQEDLAGRPFVGPAGQVFDEALAAAGIVRAEVYVTNTVKHFKWVARGKRRIHEKPNAGEVRACRPWLEAELALVEPRVIVCLGATAAQSLLGKEFRLTRERGRFFDSPWAPITATLHPSAILRMPDPDLRREAREQLVVDLKRVGERLRAPG